MRKPHWAIVLSGVTCGLNLLIPTLVVAATAGSDAINLEAHGLLDLRYLHIDAEPGWGDNGLGKLREGSAAGIADYFRVNEVALTLQGRFNWAWTTTVTGKYAHRQSHAIDVTEALLRYDPVPTGAVHFSGRLGYFFPPLSLENSGVAWSSPYTLTSSAINSWVGEELRVLGGEAQLSYQFESGDRLGAFAAGFAANDTAGALLGYRGWSLDDYKSTLTDRLPLALRSGIRDVFPLQAARTQPFVEVDGRPGYYAGLSAERPALGKWRVVYYDNLGRPDAISNGQYAWHTRFFSMGLRLALPWDSVFFGQWIDGRTQMGEERAGLFAVDTRFYAYSLLLSKSVGTQRLSVRFDQFGMTEADYFPQQANGENGHAWTANYNYTWLQRHQLNFEVTHIRSARAARSLLLLNPIQEDTQWQVAYRYFF